MAHHDHDRRSAYDYMHGNPIHQYEGAGTSWVGIAIGIAAIAFILFMLIAAGGDRTTTGDAIRQTPPTTSTAPAAPVTQPQ